MEGQLIKLDMSHSWVVVPYPRRDNITILPRKWAFALKADDQGYITQYRARCVVCGNCQRPGRDFDENYAPVATDQGVKLFYNAVALESLKVRQFDVVTAYLNAQIYNREVYVRMPTGFSEQGKVCLLLQALYGLRQAAFL